MLKLESKLVVGFDATTGSSNHTLTAQFDTVGFSRAVINLWHGGVAAAATADGPATLKLGEGDTSTAYTDIAAFVDGGAGGFTGTPAATVVTNTNCYRFDVDLRGRKRWLNLTWTPNASQATTQLTVQCVAELYRAQSGLDTAAKQGCLQLISG